MAIVRHKTLPPYRNSDRTTITNAMYKIQDAIMVVDSEVQVSFKSRPGLESFVDMGTSAKIDGLHWFDAAKKAIVVTGGNIYTINNRFGTVKKNITTATLVTGTPVIFAEVWDQINGETRLFMANGGNIVWTNGTTKTAAVSGGRAPTKCSHVAQIDTYLACNDLNAPSQWIHSAIGDPTSMGSGSRTMVAQRVPDAILALFSKNNKLFICGRDSIEVWQNVGDIIPFAHALTIDNGIFNRYSLAQNGADVHFLNTARQAVALDVYNDVVVSDSYQQVLDNLGAITDVDSLSISSVGGRKYFILNFDNEGFSLAYDIISGFFYEWGYFNTSTNSYEAFRGRSYTFAKNWGIHLVGDKSNGQVYILSNTEYQDNGVAIKSFLEFGNQDHGSSANKRSDAMYFDFRRGDGEAGDKYEKAMAWVQYRDNGSKSWGNLIELDLGATGESTMLPALRPMGNYRQRQMRIVFGDNANIVFNGFEEDIKSRDHI